MKTKLKIFYLKDIYNFFFLLFLLIFFFSTTKSEGKAFKIDNIEISKPFEMNFNKNQVIDEGFKKAFSELILLIVNSLDQEKLKKAKLNEIKGMIETFTIAEERFIKETYYVNLGVLFNKKKIFKYLESKNVFPSIPIKKRILFIPIIIDENQKELLIFSENKIFQEWNKNHKNFHLIEYILPTEDLEDLRLLKQKFEFIEKYDFKEIKNKYDLEDIIVALIFKDGKKIRVLSRISLKDNIILKNQTFTNIDLDNLEQIKDIIGSLKIVYEDYWKSMNQINTSIKLPIKIKVSSSDNERIEKFEDTLNEIDLIYNFFISKFDKEFVYYNIIFNGTPNNFLKNMSKNNLNFDTQNTIWILR
tara:strand:- start:585 stop:1664 length:1080 start_codon:yes stop_codon:yes gene_type:complete